MNASLLPADRPSWPAPAAVSALFTTRGGGVSTGAWGDIRGSDGLNLGSHCGDEAERVLINRQRLAGEVGGPIQWMQQVHGTRVVEVTTPDEQDTPPVADAQFTTTPGLALGVLVADCLPVLLTDRAGGLVAVAHAGWRGLAAGVLESVVAAMRTRRPDTDLMAWLGPCIGASVFEVGDEVRDAFASADTGATAMFRASLRPGKWWADLAGLATRRLERIGVVSISGSGACTVTDRERYWSYRRDRVCGRMAGVIWLRP